MTVTVPTACRVEARITPVSTASASRDVSLGLVFVTDGRLPSVRTAVTSHRLSTERGELGQLCSHHREVRYLNVQVGHLLFPARQ